MRRWKPGEVALVDSWRGKGQLAFRCGRIEGQPTWCVLDEHDTRGLDDHEVTQARPVVIIDPEDAEQVERLTLLHLACYGVREGTKPEAIEKRHMADALREFANPTPRIEEPGAVGAIVQDRDGDVWVRRSSGYWEDLKGPPGDCRAWSNLSGHYAPLHVLSYGVTPEEAS